jgi:hypothetical protein
MGADTIVLGTITYIRNVSEIMYLPASDIMGQETCSAWPNWKSCFHDCKLALTKGTM